MSYLTALVIFTICVLVAVAVCVPFIYIARKLRRRRDKSSGRTPTTKLSTLQAIPGLILVIVLFLTSAQQYISPAGWLGARVSTETGRLWLSLLVFLIYCVINYLWFSIASRKRKAKQAN